MNLEQQKLIFTQRFTQYSLPHRLSQGLGKRWERLRDEQEGQKVCLGD